MKSCVPSRDVYKRQDLLLEKGVYRDLYAMQLKESTKGSELFAVGDHQLNLKNL